MKEYKYIILLIIISIFSHIPWFSLNTIISAGDWYYWQTHTARNLIFSWNAWNSFTNIGMPNIQIPFLFFMTIWSLLIRLGLDYNFALKFTFLIPISIFLFVSPFILVRKFTKNSFVSFLSSLFYGSTTIAMFNQLPIQFVYAIAPLILFLFISALEKNKIHYWFYFCFAYVVGIFYEVRIMYLVTWILLFYYMFSYLSQTRRYIKNFLISLVTVFGLNAFWIFPTFGGKITNEIHTVTSRGLFGNQLFDVSHAFTIFNWLWTGGRPDNTFNVQPVIWYFWVFPIISFLAFLFFKRFNRDQQKNILFFGFISLLGIFLTKQSAVPFSYVYEWLYMHFPGFSLFRESSKLFLITATGYLGLLSYSLLYLSQRKRILFILLSLLLIIFSLFNMRPLFFNQVGGITVGSKINRDYAVLNKFISSQSYYSRSLWVPVFSRWGDFSNYHPILSESDFINPFASSEKSNPAKVMLAHLNKDTTHNLFDELSVRYIIVPLEDKANDDDFFPNYGEPRQYYINELNKISWLKRIDIGTKEIAVYENPSYRPHIYTTQDKETITKEVPYGKIQFNFINPAQYTLTIDHVNKPLYVNFSESYNPNWKMHVGDFSWFKVLTDKNYFLLSKWHFQNDATLNSFYIDPTVVCNVKSLSSYKVGENGCVKNSDGTYTIHATLYFTPQSYMYLGLIISGATLAGILGYLSFVGVFFLRKKYAKHS